MPKERSTVVPLLSPLDPAAGTPLHRQLFEGLRAAILDGRLRPGTRLTSTRDLARELGCSRNTVLAAYDQLTAEGYLEGRTGAGSFVSDAMPAEPAQGRIDTPGRGATTPPLLSRRGELLARTPVREGRARDEPIRPFRAGLPALESFPADTWARIASRHWRHGAAGLLGYGDPAGYPPLRRAIANYLRVSRGVRCTDEQVIVVSGSQQGLDLVARMLLDPGDVAWVEDPGYAGVHGALRGAGVTTVPVPVDAAGLDVEAGTRLGPGARLVSVTPSHQYPAGVTMSLARRLALLAWTSRSRAWVLEDDYDAEFRYSGRALEALQGLDTDGRVIYLGTFSKVLAPALRIGYLVVPHALIDAFANARDLTGRHAPMVEQAILAEFIAEGHFARHLRRMRALYAMRQSALVEAARELTGGLLDVRPAEAGMHVVGWLPEGLDGAAVTRRAAARGVEVRPFVTGGAGDIARHGLMLGYAPYEPPAIRTAMAALAAALSEQ